MGPGDKSASSLVSGVSVDYNCPPSFVDHKKKLDLPEDPVLSEEVLEAVDALVVAKDGIRSNDAETKQKLTIAARDLAFWLVFELSYSRIYNPKAYGLSDAKAYQAAEAYLRADRKDADVPIALKQAETKFKTIAIQVCTGKFTPEKIEEKGDALISAEIKLKRLQKKAAKAKRTSYTRAVAWVNGDAIFSGTKLASKYIPNPSEDEQANWFPAEQKLQGASSDEAS